MRNFIQTENPFGLAIPPDWFLVALAAYDPLLVIFPSRSAPVYRMARRTSTGRAQLNRVLQSIPDSQVYVDHKLWAWKSVEPQVVLLGNGWHKLLSEIPAFDQQRFGTAEEVNARLDAIDQEQEAEVERDIQTELDARSHDAFNLAQARLGARVGSGIRPTGSRRAAAPGHHRPLNFSGGAIFTGR